MPQTFPALLTGDQLQWSPSRPAVLPKDQPIWVNVTVSDDSPTNSPQGTRMSAALEQLARLAPFAEVNDPVGWQRELRSDRSLPGRD